MFTQKRRYNKNPARRRLTSPGATTFRTRQTPINVINTVLSGSTLQVQFDQPVIIGAVPQYRSANGHLPTNVVQDTTDTVEMTYSTAPTSPFTVPFEDPGIRNSAGGYVRDELLTAGG